MAARTAAARASTLDELQAMLAGFDGCALKATAKNLCFYRGAPRARLMVIGEAPGRDEDLAGKPFVGRAGQLLDKMLAAIGLGEADVHITNIVYWRPPGNRTPTPQEAQACRPFLARQVELVAPDLVLLLGGAAANHMLGAGEGIMRVRGKWREATLGSRTVRAIATLHPAYLLRTPAAKRLVWRDLLAVKAALRPKLRAQ
jgi:DNA polymerase